MCNGGRRKHWWIWQIQSDLPKFCPSKFTLFTNFVQIWLQHWLLQMHAPFHIAHDDSNWWLYGLLLKSPAKCVLLTKKKRMHCDLARFTFCQCSFMLQLAKVFPAILLNLLICQTFPYHCFTLHGTFMCTFQNSYLLAKECFFISIKMFHVRLCHVHLI